MKSTLRAAIAALSITASILAAGQDKPTPLPFSKMLQPTPRGLSPTATMSQLDGKRVLLEGFMALLEDPAKGGFWMTANPVFQDESGAGSGDLPPNAVFVVVRGAGNKPVSHLAGKLAVTGILRLRDSAPRITVVLDSEKDVAGKPQGGNQR